MAGPEPEQEEEQHKERLIPRICDIPGVRVRRRVDPARSRERALYRVQRASTLSLRGRRVRFTISDDSGPLYSTKMKGRRPSGALPIAAGGKCAIAGGTLRASC